MKINSVVVFLLHAFAFSFLCVDLSRAQTPLQSEVKVETLDLFDKSRNRSVPVALYSSDFQSDKSKSKKKKLAIINHGYGMKNTDYSFLAETLLANDYFVASIQHELPTEEAMPTTGKPSEVRRPFWERGAANILFIIEELKKSHLELDFKNLLLLGHSNGGDTVMLFAEKYPKLAKKIISLDNRRMPLPHTKKTRILTIRSSDQPADEGVLPNAEEQKRFKIKIVKLQNTIHNDMWDGATTEQKREMSEIIANFLKAKFN